MDNQLLHFEQHPLNYPPALYGKIWQRILRERQLRTLKLQILASSGAFAAFLAVGIMLLPWMGAEAGRTGFLEYLRLGISDFDVVRSNFVDFFWTLLESLPAVGLMVAVATGACIAGASSFLWREIKQLRELKQQWQ